MSVFGWKEARRWKAVAEARESRVVAHREVIRDLLERNRALRLRACRAESTAAMWRQVRGPEPKVEAPEKEHDSPASAGVGAAPQEAE